MVHLKDIFANVGFGCGTNTKAEVMALWNLPWFSKILNIPNLHIYGVSKILIDYVLGWAHILQFTLQGWCFQVQQL